MTILRTPDACFESLADFPFAPHYFEAGGLRIHYLDEGPAEAPAVLLMHGEPSWCYLYRHMIPLLVDAGHRCLAPDLAGFGRSDKLAGRDEYSYQFHVDLMGAFVRGLELQRATLFAQDWGGLIGLRVLADHPERFDHVVVANTGLPTGDHPPSEGFRRWLQYSQTVADFHIGGVLKGGCATPLAPATIAAYNAPFPTEDYKAGARAFPLLVPITPDDPASEPNRKAWRTLHGWNGRLLTLFSDQDPITAGGERPFQKLPAAQGQPHATIAGAGHFLQEDKSKEIAARVIEWLAACV